MECERFTECTGKLGGAEIMVAISRAGLVVVVILFSLAVRGQIAAQPPADKGAGFTPTLPKVEEKGQDPKAVKSFIDSLSKNDAMFEVILGQSRILTTKE